MFIGGKSVSDWDDVREGGIVSDSVSGVGKASVNGVDHIGGYEIAELEGGDGINEDDSASGNTEILSRTIDYLDWEGRLRATCEVCLGVFEDPLEDGIRSVSQNHRLLGQNDVLVVIRVEIGVLGETGVEAGSIEEGSSFGDDKFSTIRNVIASTVKLPVGVWPVKNRVSVPEIPIMP